MTTIGGLSPRGMSQRVRNALRIARWADRSGLREPLAGTIDLATTSLDSEIFRRSVVMTPAVSINVQNGRRLYEPSTVNIPERRLYSIGPGLVHGHTGIVFHGDAIILQSGPPLRDLSLVAAMAGSATAIKAAQSGGVTVDVDGPILPLGREPLPNFYHWMVDVLPRVLHAAKHHPDMTVIGSKIPAWARAMIELLGIPSLITSSVVRSPQVLLADHTHPTPHPLDIAMLRQAGRRITEDVDPPPPRDRVFVTRSTSTRTMQAGEAADRRADELGFEVFVPSAYHEYRSQVAAFCAARTIIGAHGAGLVNMVFAQPGADVVEIVPDPSPLTGDSRALAERLANAPLFRHLAIAAGHNYHREVIPTTVETPFGSASDVITILERHTELSG